MKIKFFCVACMKEFELTEEEILEHVRKHKLGKNKKC